MQYKGAKVGLAKIKIPNELSDKLDKVSKETSKPKSFDIERAIKTYLEEYYVLNIALSRLQDKDDGLITDEELKKALGL